MIKAFKKAETKKVVEKGKINEKDLRHRNNKLSRKIIGSSAAIVGVNAFGKKVNKRILPGEGI